MPDADLLRFYRSEIKYESDLLANRLNSFIASQSFLVIAYASAMNGLIGRWHLSFTLLFPPVVALLGLLLALQALPGIHAASAVIAQWQQKQNALFATSNELDAYRLPSASATQAAGADTIAQRHRQGMVFARHSPWIFAAAWSYFMGLAIYLYWCG